jgi:flagellar protein FliO/FliZ
VDNILLALRVVVSLGVVIGAIWFVRRRSSRGGARTKRASKPMSVIARQNLGPKASLAVIAAGSPRATSKQNSRDFAHALGQATEATPLPKPAAVRLAKNDTFNTKFVPSSSNLTGSILSAATWKQAWLAIRGRG